jgi:hypothetical protein
MPCVHALTLTQAELGDIVYVELPEVGKAIKQGETFGVVESVKARINSRGCALHIRFSDYHFSCPVLLVMLRATLARHNMANGI